MHGHLRLGETVMLARMIGTVLGVGYLRPAPGTWGSLVALPWALLLHVLGGFWLLAIGVLAAFVKGWWATAQMTTGSEDHDPSEIVMTRLLANGSLCCLYLTGLGPTEFRSQRFGPVGLQPLFCFVCSTSGSRGLWDGLTGVATRLGLCWTM